MQKSTVKKANEQNFHYAWHSGQNIRNFSKQSTEEQKQRIRKYWAERSHDFAILREKELSGAIARRWMEELAVCLPEMYGGRALDVGTGGGFFAFLLDDMGYETTGIDLTPEMIDEANRIGQKLGSRARFQVMDAENPAFPDDSFDLIVTRNMTWTLPHPERAYAEWHRILKPGGVLVNFDGNYGKERFSKPEEELPENHAHKMMDHKLCQECDAIKAQLEISRHSRPAWDVMLLEKAGFGQMDLDLCVSSRIYIEMDEFYNPTPLFRIRAVK